MPDDLLELVGIHWVYTEKRCIKQLGALWLGIHSWLGALCIGGSKGGCQGCAPPLGVQILSFS